MLKEDMKIVDPIGLHARPAGQLADIAGKFNCAISFIFRDRAVNAKSIINLMSLGIVKDSQVSIVCDGVDEIDAMGAIKRFMAESKLI